MVTNLLFIQFHNTRIRMFDFMSLTANSPNIVFISDLCSPFSSPFTLNRISFAKDIGQYRDKQNQIAFFSGQSSPVINISLLGVTGVNVVKYWISHIEQYEYATQREEEKFQMNLQ